MVNLVFADVETNGLNPDKIHCVALQTNEMSEPILMGPKYLKSWVDIYQPKKWVFHNGLNADVKWINELIEPMINPRDVVDTFVVSRLVDFNKYQTHSLDELGKALGVHKGSFSGPWEEYTTEMGNYCIQDVTVLKAVFDHFRDKIYDPSWAKAMRLEHDMAIISADMSNNGFYFDKYKANVLLSSIESEMKVLEDQLQDAFPPQLEEVNRIKYRTKKNGELYATVEEALKSYPLTQRDGDDLVCYEYKPFNPGSPKDRIDKLWDSGWRPTEMTKGHKKYLKEVRNAKGRRYF